MTLHDDIQSHFGDYLARELDESTHEEVRSHLERCPECRAELSSLRELFAQLGQLPREVEPERDLFHGIATRIGDPNEVSTTAPAAWTAAVTVDEVGAGAMASGEQGPSPTHDASPVRANRAPSTSSSQGNAVRRFWQSFFTPGPALAGALGALAVLVGVILWAERGREPGQTGDLAATGSTEHQVEATGVSAPESAGVEGRPATPRFVSSLVRALEYECMGAGKELYAAASAGDVSFGPGVDQALDTDVKLLDDAIDETLAALEADPDDAQLLQMLTQRYQQKLALLHRAIRLAEVA